MATDLKSHASGVSLTRFYGGKDRGSCVQITTEARYVNSANPLDFFKNISLTRSQAAALAADLRDCSQRREESI